MKSEICLVRHGITEGNKLQVFYGGVDIPLLDEGKEELTKLRDEGLYPEYSNVKYFTSGMIRTEQTLELAFGKQPHEQIELLKEINFGKFEMCHYRELKNNPEFMAFFKDKSGLIAPPEGECITQFRERILQGFEELKVQHFQHVLSIRNQEKLAATVAVIHGGPIGAIMDSIWPDQVDNFFEWTPDPGHGYILTLEEGVFVDYKKF